MPSYLILGAGKFGRLALKRLLAQDPVGRFVIVDRSPVALAALAIPPEAEVAKVAADVTVFLQQNLSHYASWDWLIPMVPVHVALAGLPADLLTGRWKLTEVPQPVENIARMASRGPQGELYLSRADHLCPDDCPEPGDVCPVSGESRSPALYEELAALRVPGFRPLVIPCRQLAPGVGGYPPGELLALAGKVAASTENLLIATACRCHGVVHALQRLEAEG